MVSINGKFRNSQFYFRCPVQLVLAAGSQFGPWCTKVYCFLSYCQTSVTLNNRAVGGMLWNFPLIVLSLHKPLFQLQHLSCIEHRVGQK